MGMGKVLDDIYSDVDFSSMRQEFDHSESINEIESGFYKNPLEFCQLGGSWVTYKTAYYLVNYFKFKSKDIAKKMSHSGHGALYNAPEEARLAVLEMTGLTELHLANTVFDATLANKKKYNVIDGELTVNEDPDHGVRLQAAEIAAKWRGMNAAEKVEINDLSKMNQEKVVELIREENKQIVPGQHIKEIENENTQKKEEEKEDGD